MNQQRHWNEFGLVLKRYTSGERDRQVIVFMRGIGKISVKARGAKKLTSPFISRLSPMNICQMVLYRTSSGHWTITQCETIHQFTPLQNTTEKNSIGLAILDIVDRCTEQNHPNPGLYDIAVETLSLLETTTDNEKITILFHIFQVKVFEMLGLLPSFSHCTECHQKLDITLVEKWNPLEIKCDPCLKKDETIHQKKQHQGFTKDYLKILNFMKKNPIHQSLKIEINTEASENITQILRMLWNVQTFSLPKSLDVLASLHA